MITSPLTAQAIYQEISTMSASIAQQYVFKDAEDSSGSTEPDYGVLDWFAKKALTITWQEYAMSCGTAAYHEWKEASEEGDMNRLGEWCEQYMNAEADPSAIDRMNAALATAQKELSLKADQEYHLYTEFVQSVQSSYR